MTLEATLSRGSESIDLPLLEEGAGAPVVSVDYGKPEAGEASRGTIDPRWRDHRSGVQTITLSVRFRRESAHSDALDLADLIKSGSGGQDMTLEIPLPEFPNSMLVAPSPQAALTINYPPGYKDYVDVQTSFTRVNELQGATQPYETPRAGGDGPITLSDGSNSVPLINGVEVEREVARPNSNLSPTTMMFPNYIDHHKSAEDGFSLSCVFKDNAISHAESMQELVGTPLSRNALTLDFNGLYGMGTFDVVPSGSQGARLVRASGEKDIIRLEELNLRTVMV